MLSVKNFAPPTYPPMLKHARGKWFVNRTKGLLIFEYFYFSGEGVGSAYSTYAFGRGLPQKCTKACKRGRKFKIAEFRAYVLFEWPLRQPGFCLIFILSKNKGILFGAQLKISTSFPSMEEFFLDIQKYLTYKQRLNFVVNLMIFKIYCSNCFQ